MRNTRVDYIDIAKGITIFLVIMGHAAGNLDTPYYRVVLYTFHMPLFFMLSGITMRPRQNYNGAVWKDIIRKNILCLAVPYFIWGLFYCQFSYANASWLVYGSWRALGNAGTLTSLWYIPCLFLVRLEIHLLFQLFNRCKADPRVLSAGAAVASFAIAFLLPHNDAVGYPWCFDVSFMALGFVLLGYALKGILDRLNQLSLGKITVLFFLSLALSIAGFWYQGESLALMLMCNSVYNSIPAFFWNALVCSAVVLFLAMISSNYNVVGLKPRFRYIGQNTFAIFLLHKPILQEVVMPIFGLAGFDAYNFWIVFIASFLTLRICRWAMQVIERYIPQLLGKFPAPTQKVVQNAEEL